MNGTKAGEVVRKTAFLGALVLLGLLLAIPPAQADPILLDPATLHLGPGAGDPCATGCAGDPNSIGSNRLDIYQNQGGASDPITDLLLILAVPNVTNSTLFSSASISSVTSYNPYPGGAAVAGSETFGKLGGIYGWSGNGYNGSMTSGEVYGFLTLNTPHDNSNSFVNFAGTDLSRFSITATGYGIYVFNLNTTLDANGLVDVQFASNLPTGTIAAAFGETSNFIYDNPYTEAGISGPGTSAPEPTTLLLLGSGLVGLSGIAWRKSRRG